MSYFDQRVYNFDNLNQTDQELMRGYDLAVQDCLTCLDNIIVDYDAKDTLSKIKAGFLEKVRKELVMLMKCSWVENIVSLIDNGEKDVELLETYQVPDWFEEDGDDDDD